MVYVLNKNGHPLMPTVRHGKIRRMLKSGEAKVICRCPFTVQLLYDTTDFTQEINLGVDAGSKHIGISATTKDNVLYESDVELRNDIVELLATRRASRRNRRSRKTRYRKPRFKNRKKTDGWLAPSVKQKVECHLAVVSKLYKFLPISKIIVETASFDIQKLKADLANLKKPEGADYQHGEQMGFWNVREYVLFRDNHTCQCCKGKSKDKILNVHHIESRKTGGNAPNNLVTLCEYCHNQYHLGNIKLPEKIKRGASFKDAAFMGVMRWAFYNKLKEEYPNVHMTYGYITKNTRIKHNLPKEHYIDARCVSGNTDAVSNDEVFYQKKVRCHNRQMHKYTINHGGIRKNNQLPHIVRGFRLHDTVMAKGDIWYIHGRRAKGGFVLKKLDGATLEIAPSKIRFIGVQQGYLTERRYTG